ncbi:MAG: hypothetical protein U0837_04080 [Dehalococcoidia bacterium]|jgi:hypothetical protein
MAEWRDRLHVAAPKVVDYLLAEEHPDGASKAKFFSASGSRLASQAASPLH